MTDNNKALDVENDTSIASRQKYTKKTHVLGNSTTATTAVVSYIHSLTFLQFSLPRC
jgi:hypothetical protein